MSTIEQQTIDLLRAQNAELLEQLATAQEFIGAFPTKLLEARLDAKAGNDTSYDYVTHARILAFASGPQAIRSQQEVSK